jgi:hypothetical protein
MIYLYQFSLLLCFTVLSNHTLGKDKDEIFIEKEDMKKRKRVSPEKEKDYDSWTSVEELEPYEDELKLGWVPFFSLDGISTEIQLGLSLSDYNWDSWYNYRFIINKAFFRSNAITGTFGFSTNYKKVSSTEGKKIADGIAKPELWFFAFNTSLRAKLVSEFQAYLRLALGSSQHVLSEDQTYIFYYSGEIGLTYNFTKFLYVGMSYELTILHSVLLNFHSQSGIIGFSTSL